MIRVGMIAPDSDRITLVDIDPGLEAFQEAVGGYIEHVTLIPGQLGMYVNEEGKLDDLPYNELGTALMHACGYADYIAGSAVLVGPADGDGNDTGLSAETIVALGEGGFTIVQAAGP